MAKSSRKSKRRSTTADYYPRQNKTRKLENNATSLGNEPNATVDNDGKVHPKMRMREWLLMHLDRSTVPTLSWENAKRGIFRIDWKHGSRQGWDKENDSEVFRLWAIHQGRYREGDDAKKWKATFRCAINSLPDVREISKDEKKRGPTAHRLYEFKEPKLRKRAGHKKNKRGKKRIPSPLGIPTSLSAGEKSGVPSSSPAAFQEQQSNNLISSNQMPIIEEFFESRVRCPSTSQDYSLLSQPDDLKLPMSSHKEQQDPNNGMIQTMEYNNMNCVNMSGGSTKVLVERNPSFDCFNGGSLQHQHNPFIYEDISQRPTEGYTENEVQRVPSTDHNLNDSYQEAVYNTDSDESLSDEAITESILNMEYGVIPENFIEELNKPKLVMECTPSDDILPFHFHQC